MITSIKGIAYKFLKGNKLILFSSIIAIFISTILIIGMFNFADKSSENFQENIRSQYGIQDMLVGYESDSNKSLTKQIEDKIKNISGVKDVERILISNFDGGMVVGSTNGYMTKSRYGYSRDLNDNNVVITDFIKNRDGLVIGDSININGELFEIKEIIEGNVDLKIINIDKLREFSGNIDGGTYSLLKTNSDNRIIATELKNIDKDFRVEIIDEYEELKDAEISLKIYISFLGFLILLIGSLFINSNMQNLLYKYKEQFALLRAIGASGKDAFKILFIQSSIINILGVSIAVMVSCMLRIFNIYSTIIALLIFIILEVLTIVSPMKGLKVVPLNTYRENELSIFNPGTLRKKIGTYLAIGSILIIILTSISKENNNFIYAFIASIVLVIAFILLLPFLLNSIIDRFWGNIAKIISSKRRNYICILIITITTIISVFGASFLSILNRNEIKYLKNLYPKDITVHFSENGVGEEVYNKIKSIENINYSALYIDYVPMIKNNEVLDFNMSFNSTLKEDEVILSKEIAEKYRINKGDILSVRKESYENYGVAIDNGKMQTQSSNYEVAKVKVINIVSELDENTFYYDGMMNINILEQLREYKEPVCIYIETNDIESVKLELKEIQKEYPEIYYGVYKEELQRNKNEVNKRWGIFKISILAMILSTFFGIYNMIIDYIYSRKCELQTLRALGVTRMRLVINIINLLIVYFTIGISCGSILGALISGILNYNA